MQNLEENHLTFKKYSNDGQLIYCWTMDKINHHNQIVWIMNHFFVNPNYPFKTILENEIPIIVNVATETNHQIWPLDPAVIAYFSKNKNLKKIWYHKPAKI